MTLRFTVLASGSAGNASLIEVDGLGVLLDGGIGPRTLASRFAAVNRSWDSIHAFLLTHTHTDHWNDRTFAHLRRRGIAVYCHGEHQEPLLAWSDSFRELHAAGLVRHYEPNQELALAPNLRCRPLPLRHDGGATFGFRFEVLSELFGPLAALGYVADLGCWDGDLLASLLDLDLLALEFNHDVELEYRSGRHPRLIARVLGDEGHLSNEQAAGLLHEVLSGSSANRLQHLIQLHLSRECNRPALARSAAQAVLNSHQRMIAVHTASQDAPGPTLRIGPAAAVRRKPPRKQTRKEGRLAGQALLPGMEEG
jgi:phosphoribosyl 1,2-cyclic phosphodiesterase